MPKSSFRTTSKSCYFLSLFSFSLYFSLLLSLSLFLFLPLHCRERKKERKTERAGDTEGERNKEIKKRYVLHMVTTRSILYFVNYYPFSRVATRGQHENHCYCLSHWNFRYKSATNQLWFWVGAESYSGWRISPPPFPPGIELRRIP